MKLYDTIVVGGGPVGSYTACKLAEKGCKVIVLERKRRVAESVCCTGIIGQECVSAFDIKAAVILRKVNSARIFSPSGECLNLWRKEPQACILDRQAFDIAMAERAQEAGADYSLRCRAKDIALERNKVRVMVSCQGKESALHSKAVVIACGFGSGLCERLGLGGFSDFTIGAQAEVETSGVDEVEVYFSREVAPGFFAWLVPTRASMARVGLMSRWKPGAYLKSWMSSLANQGRIASAQTPISCGGIPLKPRRRTCGERLLVVGDAAGQVKPTSGGGIYYGLLSADIAAETLHQALANGDLSAGYLARYEREWRRRLGWELRIGYWARKLFEHLGDHRIDRIFKMIKARGIDETLLKAEDLSFDWHSKTILRLLRYQIVSGAMNLIKFPLKKWLD